MGCDGDETSDVVLVIKKKLVIKNLTPEMPSLDPHL